MNGRAGDNRIANLREATRGENAQNLAFHPHNTSGYRGVTWDPENEKWRAQLHANGAQVNIGRFATAEAASAAYLAAKKAHHKFQPVPRQDTPC